MVRLPLTLEFILGSGGRLLWLRLSSYGEKMWRRKVRLSDILFGYNQHWKNNIKCRVAILQWCSSGVNLPIMCSVSLVHIRIYLFYLFVYLFLVIIWHSHTCILAIFISQFSLNFFPPPSIPFYKRQFLIFFFMSFCVLFICTLWFRLSFVSMGL